MSIYLGNVNTRIHYGQCQYSILAMSIFLGNVNFLFGQCQYSRAMSIFCLGKVSIPYGLCQYSWAMSICLCKVKIISGQHIPEQCQYSWAMPIFHRAIPSGKCQYSWARSKFHLGCTFQGNVIWTMLIFHLGNVNIPSRQFCLVNVNISIWAKSIFRLTCGYLLSVDI